MRNVCRFRLEAINNQKQDNILVTRRKLGENWNPVADQKGGMLRVVS